MHYTQNPLPEKSEWAFWVICVANIYKKSQTTKKKLSNKVISALRLLSKSSFTPSKLRFFGLRKP